MKTACETKSIHICRLTKENKCGYFSQSPGNEDRCSYWKIGWNCHNNEAWPENQPVKTNIEKEVERKR